MKDEEDKKRLLLTTVVLATTTLAVSLFSYAVTKMATKDL